MSKERASPRERFEAMNGTPKEKLYEQMFLIRRFEERLLVLFEEGVLTGTTHACIGQEADCVGVLNHLEKGDLVFSNHRCHGHYLVYADDPRGLAAEIMGRVTGVVGGRGGSQHICVDGFYSNGIQGGIVPVLVGMTLAEKRRGRSPVGVVFLGDGTLGEGVVYEAFNMASLWSVPVLFVVEDNRWAQSTPVELELAGHMVRRGEAFGISSGEIESTDAEELFAHFEPLVEKVRREGRPHLEVIHTYRLCHHSKSDDKRPEEEVEARRAEDPLPKMRARLSDAVAVGIEAGVEARLDIAFEEALAAEEPDPKELADPLETSTTGTDRKQLIRGEGRSWQ